MKIIITGGTGLIGQALIGELVKDRHEIVVLSRSEGGRNVAPARLKTVRWDGRSADGWGALADGADAIVNLAGANIGERRWTAARKNLIVESREAAGRAVSAAIAGAKNPPKVLVQASGIDYYRAAGNREVAEDAPAGDSFLARTAVRWEASTAAVSAMGVRRIVIRSAMVLSAEGGALPKMLRPFRFYAGGPLGGGRQWLPWIHVNDEVRAIKFLIENEAAAGAFNLCAPNPLPNREFMRALGRALSRPSALPAPAFFLRLSLGEMADLLLDGRRAVPRKLLQLGFSFEYPLLEDALAAVLKG